MFVKWIDTLTVARADDSESTVVMMGVQEELSRCYPPIPLLPFPFVSLRLLIFSVPSSRGVLDPFSPSPPLLRLDGARVPLFFLLFVSSFFTLLPVDGTSVPHSLVFFVCTLFLHVACGSPCSPASTP